MATPEELCRRVRACLDLESNKSSSRQYQMRRHATSGRAGGLVSLQRSPAAGLPRDCHVDWNSIAYRGSSGEEIGELPAASRIPTSSMEVLP